MVRPPALARRFHHRPDVMQRLERRIRRQPVRSALLAFVIVLTGWFVYQQFFWSPPRLPVPDSTTISVSAGPGSWSTANGDLGARRVTEASAHLDGEIAWTRSLAAPAVTAVVADERALYLALEDGLLTAISVDDGRTLWERQMAFPLRTPPTLAAGRLHVPRFEGQMQALDAATGDLIWEIRTGSSFAASPVVLDGVVYGFFFTHAGKVAGNGELIGFAAEDGAVLWRLDADALWPVVPPIFEGSEMALAAGKQLQIVDRDTGLVQYSYTWGPSRPAHMAIARGVVYGVTPRLVVAVDTGTRSPWWNGLRRTWTWAHIFGVAPSVPRPPREWRVRPPQDPYAPVLAADGVIVAGQRGEVRSYNIETGEQHWRTFLEPVVGPPLLTADGLLLTLADALVLLDPGDGSERGRYAVASGGLAEVVVTASGTYLVFEDGALSALK